MNHYMPFIAITLAAMLTACSSTQKNTAKDAADALPFMVIDRLDFDRSFNMPCERHRDCTLPLTCNHGTCGIPPAILGTPLKDSKTLEFTTDGKKHTIFVETATTQYTRQMGMMKRKKSATGWGMLFVFANNAKRSFWMSNTYIPLDILFIRKDGTLANAHTNAVPLDENPRYTSSEPVRYVLELPAGSIHNYGISKNTKFDMTAFEDIHPER